MTGLLDIASEAGRGDDRCMKNDRLDEILGLLDNNTCTLEAIKDELLGDEGPDGVNESRAAGDDEAGQRGP
ncbi:hypothetical protein [Nocardia sp. NPDC046763]|uniref:hypothetical protein n=1 Tax=Nocardia sp. NPDC046763 TaxID=3155256 RepID=UPI0033DA0FA4